MGWLFMTSLDGHSGPRPYLDAQFTYGTPGATSRVLRSALVGMRTYYAAVEHVRNPGGAREVWAAVCLVRYNPRDRQGDIFGYKDMSESMGPCECACPEPILELLTPTDNQNALNWRQRCRNAATARRTATARPSPHPGQAITFDEPIVFADGCRLDQFEVVADPRSCRTVLYRALASGRLYCIPSVKRRPYRLSNPRTG